MVCVMVCAPVCAMVCATACATVAASAEGPRSFEQWEPEIRAFEVADRERPPKPGGVVFVGSSSIRLWATLADDFPGVDVLNRGFGGSEIADSTHFAGRIVVPYRPREIVFYAGDNDLASGRTPADVLGDFDAFVRRVRRDLPRVGIDFVSIKPSPARVALLGKMREANALVRRYAARRRGVVYVDVFTPMLDAAGRPRPELFGEDGLHMNRTGYELWTRAIAPRLRGVA
jgi:lysophospholipase L1-like esterase